ncbi:phosphoribosylaminoimidazolesuccinocarboxamide synthase [Pseudactinotalea sp. Z1732]|uniref:phosphoribosylaminoimidazolesuccinocarboxamide synthase n=1 Tax=Micrococcales TaxID=85006 RepID=UPI003C7E0F0B
MHTNAPDLPGWRHVYSGKVRDLYEPISGPPDRVLVVASDRISAYDHVLTSTIPDKGAVLTALSLWWFERLATLVPNHVISVEVPAAVAGRAMICRRLQMFPVECVARGYLTGSGLAEYTRDGTVCGIELPEALVDGSKLPEPIFTPATKAQVGEHDENVTFGQVARLIGDDDAARLRDVTLAVYTHAEGIAAGRGVILADTKLEFGRDPGSGALVLGDEVLTPDSSRYWPAEHHEPGRPQPSFDKQYVRDWLTSPESGWDRAGTEAPPPLPEDVVERTRRRYLHAYERVTGRAFTAG